MNDKLFISDIEGRLSQLRVVDVNEEKKRELEETFYRLDRLIDNANDSKERIFYAT